jgi:hypothetical protein
MPVAFLHQVVNNIFNLSAKSYHVRNCLAQAAPMWLKNRTAGTGHGGSIVRRKKASTTPS